MCVRTQVGICANRLRGKGYHRCRWNSACRSALVESRKNGSVLSGRFAMHILKLFWMSCEHAIHNATGAADTMESPV